MMQGWCLICEKVEEVMEETPNGLRPRKPCVASEEERRKPAQT